MSYEMSPSILTKTLTFANLSTSAPPNATTQSNPERLPLEAYYRSYLSIHGPLSLSVSLLGAIFNIANIIVLRRPSMRTATNILLMWLAVADLLTELDYIIFSVRFYISNPFSPGHFYMPQRAWIGYLLFHINFSVVCHSIAIWITIALAVFRYVYIKFPTRARRICSVDHAGKTVWGIVAIAVLFVCPNFFLYTIEYTADYEQPSVKTHGITRSPLVSNNKWLDKLNMYWSSIFIKLIPCVLLSVFTTLLIIEMHEANKRRQALLTQGRVAESNRHSETNRITGMLLAVVILFLITELPQGILFILSAVNGYYKEVYASLGDTMDLVALLNNSTNFALYCTMSTQFRKEFYSLFCLCNCNSRPNYYRDSIGGGKRHSTLLPLNGSKSKRRTILIAPKEKSNGLLKTKELVDINSSDKFDTTSVTAL